MKLDHNIIFPKVEGIKFYLAGGAVRDLIMNKQPKDLDFVMETTMTFDEVLNILKQDDRFNPYEIRPEHQIILATERVGKKLRQIDLAFPRIEGEYTDGRRPDYTIRTDSLELDASRRDFTINSMFMTEDGEIIDYFNGLKDIEQGQIRCVGNAQDRFNEDALRLLRAIRFHIKLGFNIPMDMMNAMTMNMHLITNPKLSMDRIRAEINMMLKQDVYLAMKNLIFYGVIRELKKRPEPFSFEMRQKE